MLMPGRGSDSMIGQSNVQGNILVINNDFSDGTLQGFTESGEANNENGRVKVGVHGPWYGMYRDVSLIPGRAYRARIDYDGGNFQQIGHFMFAVLALGSTLDFKYLWNTANGYELNFVVPSGASSVRVALQTPGEQASGINAYCYLDNFIIEEIKPQTVINPETNSGCITMTQPKWVTTMVDSCYYNSNWPWWKYTLQQTNGNSGSQSTATVAGPGMNFNIVSGEIATFNIVTVPFNRQEVEFVVRPMAYGNGGIVQFTEERAGVEVSLGRVNVKGAATYTTYITPTESEVKVKLIGPLQFIVQRICVKRPSLKQENVLVTICPDDKDHYRFGFNGQEKVNEWAGVGNNLDFGARSYDSRTGRWYSLDPLATKYPFASPYNFALNTPIWAKDPDGKVVIFINGLWGRGTGAGGGTKSYWSYSNQQDGWAEKAKSRIGDRRAMYFDGSSGGIWSPGIKNQLYAANRIQAGYDMGKVRAVDIVANLQRDPNNPNKITETVKFVTNSMGAAYERGFSQALTDYVKNYNLEASDYNSKEMMKKAKDPSYKIQLKNTIIGFEIESNIDVAAFQGYKLPADKNATNNYFMRSKDDIVAGYEDAAVPGATEIGLDKDGNPTSKGHHASAYDVNSLPKGKEGGAGVGNSDVNQNP